MNQQTLYIGFGGCQVAACSNGLEVLAQLRHSFCHMLEPEPTRTVACLEVQWRDGRYRVAGIADAWIEHDSLANTVECLRYEVVLRLIQVHPGLMWFHAGAAAYQGSVVIMLGSWGRGKSTLVTRLCANGWTYLSDDIIPLDPNSGKVIPFPLTPMVREDLGKEVPSERLSELSKTVVNLQPETVCREAMPINALVFPVYSYHSPTTLLPCSPAPAALELLQNCLNFTCHREAAVRYVCDLVKRVPTFRLTYNSSGKLAADLIAQAHENWDLV